MSAIPRPGETVLAPGYEQLFGGKGANQAVAAARALDGKGKVAMVGAVGRDPLGEAAVANLSAEGIDVSGILRVVEPTGCAFITVDERGENAITVASGANRLARAAGLPQAETSAADIYVMQMETPFDEVVQAARLAQQSGRTIVNLAPAPADLGGERLARLLDATDILVVNKHELSRAAGILRLNHGNDLEATAAGIAKSYRLTVLVTFGRDGAVLLEGDKPAMRVPALSVEAVDTTGAGDTLVGVLAAGLEAGLGLPDALRRAVIAASLACQTLGAQSSMPFAAQIERALQD